MARKVRRVGERYAAILLEGTGQDARVLAEVTLTEAEYRGLAEPGADAPPNRSLLSDRDWRDAWHEGRLVAGSWPLYDTPDGRLEPGDEEDKGRDTVVYRGGNQRPSVERRR